MASSFSQTLRSLGASSSRGSAGSFVAVFALVICWGAWFVGSESYVYVASSEARVEVSRLPHQVQAEVDGRVRTAVHWVLGTQVRKGELLIQLDDTEQRLALKRERTLLSADEASLISARKVLAVRRASLAAYKNESFTAIQAAHARYLGAVTEMHRAAQDQQMYEQLEDAGAASPVQARHKLAHAELERFRARAASYDADQVSASAHTETLDRLATIAALERQITTLQSSIATHRATIEELKFNVNRRQIRAPVTGTLAEVSSITPGTNVSANQRLATIDPAGTYKVVGYFPQDQALGRVRPGQVAVVHLDAFPWAEYGTLQARVTRAAEAANHGRVRVELAITSVPRSITVGPGLTADVDVRTETLSPALIVLRAVGKFVATKPEQLAAPRLPKREGP